MSKITPIRPGDQPASETNQEQPVDEVHRHLVQATAIADLLMVADADDLESLDTETVSNAMWAIKDRIEAARAAADALWRAKERQP
jgi:hypothetical protein